MCAWWTGLGHHLFSFHIHRPSVVLLVVCKAIFYQPELGSPTRLDSSQLQTRHTKSGLSRRTLCLPVKLSLTVVIFLRLYKKSRPPSLSKGALIRRTQMIFAQANSCDGAAVCRKSLCRASVPLNLHRACGGARAVARAALEDKWTGKRVWLKRSAVRLAGWLAV